MSPLFLYMCTIAPCVQCSGNSFPCCILFISMRIGCVIFVRIALYASPWIPSLPCAFPFFSPMVAFFTSLSVYSLVTHALIWGCFVVFSIRRIFSYMSQFSRDFRGGGLPCVVPLFFDLFSSLFCYIRYFRFLSFLGLELMLDSFCPSGDQFFFVLGGCVIMFFDGLFGDLWFLCIFALVMYFHIGCMLFGSADFWSCCDSCRIFRLYHFRCIPPSCPRSVSFSRIWLFAFCVSRYVFILLMYISVS